ncbi:phage tail tube protein [Cohaesibacter gelatinilyticus]|uniref:Predicted secreted protein n=1 Tax=Cohaesibacter gelatinilyticus TaxID=372072 RepID=A0A285PNM1_9HYPH|nr:phage tail tube protein [Cohaesibacter gelatinilyticus]SNZ21726.1 Predicted secreted protein [Cohaesibacter gelatinilyticus]
MVNTPGKELTIKVGDGADPEVFSLICDVKDKTLTINNNQIDTTTPSCTDPTGKLISSSEYGVQTLSLSGSGLANDGAVFQRFHDACLNQTKPNIEVNVPNVKKYTGAAFIESLDIQGTFDDMVTFDFSLSMTGTITVGDAD